MARSGKKRTILALTANPLNADRLRLDQEVRQIREAIQRAGQRSKIQFEARTAVTADDLRRHILDLKPSVVHFSGHGAGDRGLCFVNEQDQAQLIEAEPL